MPKGKNHDQAPPPERAPARAFWSGTISFGLVSIPVDLFSGVRARRTSMKMVDAEGNPLGREYYAEEHEEALAPDELVRGYETDDGKMVIVTDEELASVAPEMSRDIELRTFVPREQIPAAYYQRPYFLAPSGRSTKAYHLLAQTMEKTGRVGVGTFVMRGHQYLVAILSDNGILRAETLRFAGELRTPEDLGLPKRKKPAKKEVKRFADAIESLKENQLDMDELSDRAAAALEKLAQEKLKKGKDVVEAEAAQAEGEEEEAGGGAEVIDLMQLLKERVGASQKRAAHPPAKARRSSGGAKARASRGARRASGGSGSSRPRR